MYGMEVYSEDGYKVFNTGSKMYYTLMGKLVARVSYPYKTNSPSTGTSGWHITLPSYIKENPDKYILVLKINNNPVKLLDNRYSFSHQYPQDSQLEFFSSTAPELYVYTRGPALDSASWGLETFNAQGELEFTSGRGSQVLQTEATYQTQMSVSPGASWSSGTIGDGVIISSLPLYITHFYDVHYHIRAVEAEMKLVNGRVSVTLSPHTQRGTLLFHWLRNDRLSLAITKLPTWTVPTINW